MRWGWNLQLLLYSMNTLVDMISGMEVKEDDEDFMNAVDYMFAGLEKRKPDCFAVKQYKNCLLYTSQMSPRYRRWGRVYR